jgi:hypothetical protein
MGRYVAALVLLALMMTSCGKDDRSQDAPSGKPPASGPAARPRTTSTAPYELTLIAEKKPFASADQVYPAIDIKILGTKEWYAPTLYWGLKLVWDGKEYARKPEHIGAWNGPGLLGPNTSMRTAISVVEYTVPAAALAPGRHTMAVKDKHAQSNTIVVVIAGGPENRNDVEIKR